MARPLRPLVPDGIYHVFARCRPDIRLFTDDTERQLFLRLLIRTASAREWSCLAYCLMGSHFHLLVRTPDGDLDGGMQRLLGTFALRLNAKRGMRGPVFDDRYGAVLLRENEHLLEVIRYIALNPVRAGYCEQPSAWPWSSHRELAGEAPRTFVAVEELRTLASGLTGGRGSAGYLRLVRDAVLDGEVLPGPRTTAPVTEAPSLEVVLGAGSPLEIRCAHRWHGYSLTAIAAKLGVHVSTVSRTLARYEGRAPVQRKVSDPRRAAQRKVSDPG